MKNIRVREERSGSSLQHRIKEQKDRINDSRRIIMGPDHLPNGATDLVCSLRYALDSELRDCFALVLTPGNAQIAQEETLVKSILKSSGYEFEGDKPSIARLRATFWLEGGKITGYRSLPDQNNNTEVLIKYFLEEKEDIKHR